MKAKDLKLEELVQFNDGSICIHGRALVLHSVHAFAQFRRDLIDSVGTEPARGILTRFGFFQGQADASAMKRIFEWDDDLELLKAGARLFALEGLARVVIKNMDYNKTTGDFYMHVAWHQSNEAIEHILQLGRSKDPVCWTLTGYASGYASYCTGQSIYFFEESCRAQGHRICTAVGQNMYSWDGNSRKQFRFFESFDIRSKIMALRKELEKKTRETENQKEKISHLDPSAYPLFVGPQSRAMRKVLDIAGRVAPYDSSVLITGETGVGKELLARTIHKRSQRSKNTFLAVNCAALPKSLLESELFGFKAGAFTGATSDRTGLFEQADKGTILLDEIGDISPGMQQKILRVLQEHEIVRLGESRPRKINIRILSATNKNLGRLIAEGTFREDLYYRLGGIQIHIPPLRDRPEDILPLARLIVKRTAHRLNIPKLRFDATCLDMLRTYTWPGNVRELENIIEGAAILADDGTILPKHLPQVIRDSHITPAHSAENDKYSLAAMERTHILRILNMTGGNKQKAAHLLEIDPSTLWRKLKKIKAETERSRTVESRRQDGRCASTV